MITFFEMGDEICIFKEFLHYIILQKQNITFTYTINEINKKKIRFLYDNFF